VAAQWRGKQTKREEWEDVKKKTSIGRKRERGEFPDSTSPEYRRNETIPTLAR